jgi:hypothetical protein
VKATHLREIQARNMQANEKQSVFQACSAEWRHGQAGKARGPGTPMRRRRDPLTSLLLQLFAVRMGKPTRRPRHRLRKSAARMAACRLTTAARIGSGRGKAYCRLLRAGRRAALR